MEFLNNIASFGTPQRKPTKRVNESEQLAKMRENFATRAGRQIVLIKDGSEERKGSWYFTEPTGSGQVRYIVSLRNGAKLLPLSGQHTHLGAPSLDKAVAFYEEAIAACERGELDDVLKATSRKTKKQPADAAIPQSDQP